MAKVEVSEKLTRQVAELARLELSEQEVQLFTRQLGTVLGHIEQLQSLDVTGIAPLTHPFELATPLREDIVRPSPVDAEGKPRVLASAPEVLHDGFKVPPVL